MSDEQDAKEEFSSYDLIIRQVQIDEQPLKWDIGCLQGKITAIQPRLPGSSSIEINGSGFYASAPLIDPHTHLDKSFLQPLPNQSGTLEEAIQIMASHKKMVLDGDFEARIERALRMALLHGTTTIRTHVDLDPINGTRPIERIAAIVARWAGLVDLQVVAFPQEGLIRIPENRALLRQAMRYGATAVGGIPSLEASQRDQKAHIDFVLDVASEFGGIADMHVDETDDPSSKTLEMLAKTVIQTGFTGKVSAAHCCSIAGQDDTYARQVIDMVLQSGIHIITNPTSNLMLQGRNDSQPIRRGITRVKELLAAGVNVCAGHDNLRDPFYPFGKADMLEVAFVTALAAQLSGTEEIQTAFDMVGKRAADCLGLKNYGIRVGGPADILLISGDSAASILAERPESRVVVRAGKLVCRTELKSLFCPVV